MGRDNYTLRDGNRSSDHPRWRRRTRTKTRNGLLSVSAAEFIY